ncbi:MULTISPECIES: hypothetical protein [Amycolatopsis]|uniref:Uncharacterized protein n=2 Tax=Amycolatopsis TaxID=1813 RepID=A0A1I3UIT8_9PSEU|nr:hypothetical protein [Amycolatopsis sacchari]SFJ82805.1 hypothetical protein SAMN05421835_10978 [Amycolatopsis sacchari]
MAYKIKHRSRAQEVRFPTQAAAEQYAAQFAGGLRNWTVVEAGRGAQEAAPRDEQGR